MIDSIQETVLNVFNDRLLLRNTQTLEIFHAQTHKEPWYVA